MISEERKAFYLIKYKLDKEIAGNKISILQIAKRFNIDKNLAYKYSEIAREKNLFKTRYKFNYPKIVRIENEIKNSFRSLKDVCISENQQKRKKLSEQLAETGCWYINRLLKNKMTITISGGETLKEWVSCFNPENPFKEKREVSICTLNTDLMKSGEKGMPFVLSSTITTNLSEKFSKANYKFTLYSYDVAECLTRESKRYHLGKNSKCNCPKVVKMAEMSDLVILGIGTIKDDSTYMKYLKHCRVDIKHLLDKGVVGDIANFAITKKGEIILGGLEERMITLSLETLKRITKTKHEKYVVAMAGGEDKIDSIIGALKSELINILIIDEDTAYKIRDNIKIY